MLIALYNAYWECRKINDGGGAVGKNAAVL